MTDKMHEMLEALLTVLDRAATPFATMAAVDAAGKNFIRNAALRSPADQGEKDRKDAERYRWLRDNAKEEPLRPAAYGSEIAPDMRLKYSFPVLVSYDAIGQQISLDDAIDTAIDSTKGSGELEGERE